MACGSRSSFEALAFGTVFLAIQPSAQDPSRPWCSRGSIRNLAKGAPAKLAVSFALQVTCLRHGCRLRTVAAFAVAGLMNVATLTKMLGFTLDV